MSYAGKIVREDGVIPENKTVLAITSHLTKEQREEGQRGGENYVHRIKVLCGMGGYRDLHVDLCTGANLFFGGGVSLEFCDITI